MEKSQVISTEFGDVTVRKLALGDYADLLRALKKLPAEVGKFIEGTDNADLLKNEVLFASLPAIIADAIPEFCEVLSIPTDKDQDFMAKLDLADAIDVLVGALEVNDYSRITNSIKKLTARRTETTQANQEQTPPQTDPATPTTA